MPSYFRRIFLAVFVVATLALATRATADEGLRFEVTLDKSVTDVGITGRLFVFLSPRPSLSRSSE